MDENVNSGDEIEEENDYLTSDDTSSEESDFLSESTSESYEPQLDGPHQRLHRAAMEGNWETALKMFEKKEIEMTEEVSTLGLTALHVAAACGRSEFVKKLVKLLKREDLEAQDQIGRTAFHFVAMSAKVSAAKAMVAKNGRLPQLRDTNSDAPIMYAARWRHRPKTKKMLEYLCEVTKEDKDNPIYGGPKGHNLIVAITASGCYDIALRILARYPELASARNEKGMSILHVFAMRPSAFREGHELSLWESFIYKLLHKEETIDGSDDANSNVIKHSLVSSLFLKLRPFKKVVDVLETKDGSDNATSNVTEYRQASAFFLKLRSIIEERNVFKIMWTQADSIKLVKFVCKELQKKKASEVFEYFYYKYNGNAVLHLAVENGVTKLVKVCLNYFPDLIWYTSNYQPLLQVAIVYRQVEIFNHLIDLIGENSKMYADSKDENGNNILHLAAKFSTPSDQLMTHSVPGPAFLMRRELQWFKAVEALVYEESKMEKNKMEREKNKMQDETEESDLSTQDVEPNKMEKEKEKLDSSTQDVGVLEKTTVEQNKMEREKEKKNNKEKKKKKKKKKVEKEKKEEKESEGQIPRELFFDQHERLLKDAKQWMKDTSSSCMVVSTLVATVAFAAIITVPSGNNSDTGLPVLSNRKLFVAFSISNALSMISSAVTLLMFLSVYTSRFTEKDFLETFPNILLRGLISLFVAIATMMIAFGTAIGLVLQSRVKWAYIPITVLACCPALIFTRLQLPLLFHTIVLAPGPGIYQGQRIYKYRTCLEHLGFASHLKVP